MIPEKPWSILKDFRTGLDNPGLREDLDRLDSLWFHGLLDRIFQSNVALEVSKYAHLPKRSDPK